MGVGVADVRMLANREPVSWHPISSALKLLSKGTGLVLPSLLLGQTECTTVGDVIFFALDPMPGRSAAFQSPFAEELEPFLGESKRGDAPRLSRHRMSVRADDEEKKPDHAPPVPYVPLRGSAHRTAAARGGACGRRAGQRGGHVRGVRESAAEDQRIRQPALILGLRAPRDVVEAW